MIVTSFFLQLYTAKSDYQLHKAGKPTIISSSQVSQKSFKKRQINIVLIIDVIKCKCISSLWSNNVHENLISGTSL